jgi:hypothetical protein
MAALWVVFIVGGIGGVALVAMGWAARRRGKGPR